MLMTIVMMKMLTPTRAHSHAAFLSLEEVIGCELLRLVSTSTTPTYVRDRSLLEWLDPIPTRATGHSDPVPQQRLAS